MKTLNAQLRMLQRRLGKPQELIAAVAIATLGAGGLIFTVTTQVGTPAGAALAYMAAVDRADVDYVWSHSVIDSSNTSAVTVSLLDKAILAAQLKSSAHSRRGFTAVGWSYTREGTRVNIAYDTANGRATTSLVMRGAAPHSWPVLVKPAGLDLSLPIGAGAVAIDGGKIGVQPGAEAKVAVFPGQHKLALDASLLNQAYESSLDAESLLPSVSAVSFAGLRLTDSATAQAKAAVSKAIHQCAASGSLRPESCTQAYTQDLAKGDVAWSVLGDPTVDATFGFSPKSTLRASGHYLMRLSYMSTTSNATRVILVGGPYAASLKWDGQYMSVSGFDPNPTASAIPQPAATNAQVLAALKAQFDSCLNLQAGSAVGCPQQVAAYYASNFVWRSNGDTIQGATVTWGATQGFFKVSGNFDFTVDYDSTPPYSGTRHYQDHASGQYVADLYWDGAKAVFVGFEK